MAGGRRRPERRAVRHAGRRCGAERAALSCEHCRRSGFEQRDPFTPARSQSAPPAGARRRRAKTLARARRPRADHRSPLSSWPGQFVGGRAPYGIARQWRRHTPPERNAAPTWPARRRATSALAGAPALERDSSRRAAPGALSKRGWAGRARASVAPPRLRRLRRCDWQHNLILRASAFYVSTHLAWASSARRRTARALGARVSGRASPRCPRGAPTSTPIIVPTSTRARSRGPLPGQDGLAAPAGAGREDARNDVSLSPRASQLSADRTCRASTLPRRGRERAGAGQPSRFAPGAAADPAGDRRHAVDQTAAGGARALCGIPRSPAGHPFGCGPAAALPPRRAVTGPIPTIARTAPACRRTPLDRGAIASVTTHDPGADCHRRYLSGPRGQRTPRIRSDLPDMPLY